MELSPASEEDGWLSLARGGLGEVSHEMWGWWGSQNRKIVPLPPYDEETLNSKVIKSFVPELRSRKCFSCFEIPMFYVIYIWTLYVHFTYSRIWLWYNSIFKLTSLSRVLSLFFFFLRSFSQFKFEKIGNKLGKILSTTKLNLRMSSNFHG